MATHRPELMIPLYRLMYGKQTPGKRTRSRTFRDDWTPGIEVGHTRARIYAKQERVNLVIGHFHCPQDYDGILVDHGDLVDSYTYLILETGPVDRAELRRL